MLEQTGRAKRLGTERTDALNVVLVICHPDVESVRLKTSSKTRLRVNRSSLPYWTVAYSVFQSELRLDLWHIEDPSRYQIAGSQSPDAHRALYP
jgi:hypothetical protein